jgi:S-adenosylhomocysteine hydrolase
MDADMPVLRAYVDRYGGGRPLQGVTALLIQHQLGNQGPQIDAMMALGLEPEKTLWVDIPYTSHASFRAEVVRRHGIPEGNFDVHTYGVLAPYAQYQFSRTQKVLGRLLDDPPERLVVLDDGAYFLEAAMGFRRQLPNVAIVEQTSRGMMKIEDSPALMRYAARFPVVNVARSRPKLRLESPWIGTAVLLALQHRLKQVESRWPEFAITPGSPCLVLGYGAVGRQVAHHLRNFAKVHVFDVDARRRRKAVEDGHTLWDRRGQALIPDDQLIRFKLVVGCTGRASFKVGDHVFLDRHAVLASASSGSVELSRGDFIDLAAASEIDDIHIHHDGLADGGLHHDLRMQLVDRNVVFLNAGFPINFDGRINCVPSKFMQATATLMVHGAVQALAAKQPGIQDVDRGFSNWLTRKFHAQLTAGERLLL